MSEAQPVSAPNGPDIHDVWRLCHDLEKYNEVECSIVIKAAGTAKAPRLLWSILAFRGADSERAIDGIFAEGALSRYSMRYLFQALHEALSEIWNHYNQSDESAETPIE